MNIDQFRALNLGSAYRANEFVGPEFGQVKRSLAIFSCLNKEYVRTYIRRDKYSSKNILR